MVVPFDGGVSRPARWLFLPTAMIVDHPVWFDGSWGFGGSRGLSFRSSVALFASSSQFQPFGLGLLERPLCSSLEAPWPCSYGSLASASQPAWPWPALLWPASLSHLGPGLLGPGPFGLGLFSLGTLCLGLLSLGPLGLGPLDLVLLVLGPLGLSQPGLGLLGLGPHCLGPLGLLGLGPISLNKLSLGPLGLGLLGPGPIGLVQTTCPNTGRHTLQSCRPRLQPSTGSR